MRTVVPSRQVAHLWAHQSQEEAKNSNGSLYFNGKTIYSYGSHFPVATFAENAAGQTAVLFTTSTYSITTSGHCSAVRSAVRHIRPLFNVPLRGRSWNLGNLADYREDRKS